MALLSTLAGLGAWEIALMAVATGFHLGALLAIGTLLFQRAFPEYASVEHTTGRRGAGPVGVIAAWGGILLALLQWPLQAAYLGGGRFAAAADPMLLGVVFEGAQGTRLLFAVSGLLLVQTSLLLARRLPRWSAGLGVIGALLVVLAFVQVGHTVGEPRLLLGGLLLVHLLAAAFWIGSLRPLYRLARLPSGTSGAARILTRFGRLAVAVVGLLVTAGVALAAFLLGGIAPLVTTAYGQFLLAKVSLVVLLLLLAAANKWRLVPAFERGEPWAGAALRRSIGLEMVLVTTVVLVTAALTSVGAPAVQ